MLLLGSILILLLALLGVVLYPVVRPGHGAPPNRAPRSIPNTDVNPFGANFFLEREVETWKREETVRMAHDAGIGWAKQQFVWAEIEPERGQFRWEKYDAIVDLFAGYGIQVVARLDSPPNWTREDNSMPGRPPDDLTNYGEFVYRFVEHYRGRIRYIQIWNEPNLFIEWGNRPVDPEGYVDLLRIAYEQAKKADPNVYVLSAPLAITLGEPHPEPGKWRAMSDLQYLEEMYLAGAQPYFDILSANAFGMDVSPEDPPSPSTLNFGRVALQREIMERFGDEDKPIWFNEYGWNAAPETLGEEALVWDRVTEEEQAAYTLEGIEYAREHWPWAGVFHIWYFRQVGDISPEDASYYFRIVDVDFIPRRIYYAIKDKAAELAQAGPGYYEETHPAVATAPGQWEVRIDANASGEATIVSDVPTSYLTFRFRGGDVYLIAQVGPGGGQLVATLDGHNVDGLPIDAQGRSYVDLYAPKLETASLLVVSDSSAKTRTLRLEVSDLQHPDSQGQQCVVDAFYVAQEAGQPFPVVPVIVLVTGCLIVGWSLRRSAHALRATDEAL
jgi:hypothetical protein